MPSDAFGLTFDNVDDFLGHLSNAAPRPADQDPATEVSIAFHDLRLRHGFTVRQDAVWETAVDITEPLADVLKRLAGFGHVTAMGATHNSDHGYESLVAAVEGDDAVLYIGLLRGLSSGEPDVELRVGAASLPRAQEVLAEVTALIPHLERSDDSDDHEVQFWSLARHGAAREHRTLPAVHWDDIAVNYTDAIRTPLAGLMAADQEALPARLHLWSGPPGTGKTHAVRALGSAWREWCNTDYISDPEQFFASAEYMNQVIHRASDDARWSLLILEDAGEFLSPDAPIAVGQGFSRLMNISDGMLGEGMRVILLLTTNTDIRDLHPAASRPGRAASNLSFGAFGIDEATAWLEAKGSGAGATSAMTLAELYAQLEQAAPVTAGTTARSIGFTA